jgi:hypothetical protein
LGLIGADRWEACCSGGSMVRGLTAHRQLNTVSEYGADTAQFLKAPISATRQYDSACAQCTKRLDRLFQLAGLCKGVPRRRTDNDFSPVRTRPLPFAPHASKELSRADVRDAEPCAGGVRRLSAAPHTHWYGLV